MARLIRQYAQLPLVDRVSFGIQLIAYKSDLVIPLNYALRLANNYSYNRATAGIERRGPLGFSQVSSFHTGFMNFGEFYELHIGAHYCQ